MSTSAASPTEEVSLSFLQKLENRVESVNSLLCVGLDPHPSDVEGGTSQEDRCDAVYTFCKTLIDATLPYTACYKPNIAFFEQLGTGGLAVLQRVLNEIPPQVPVLLDVKRGDIGSTAQAYASACYDHFHVDAVTLSPLMGWDSIQPFVTESYSNKAAFVLCKTSNPGSNELMTLKLANGQQTLYQRIAHLVGHSYSQKATLGLVVGATDPLALETARRAAGDKVWILAPGVGAQGGDLTQAVQAGINSTGLGLLVPVSRGISRAEDPAKAAQELQEQINAARTAPKTKTNTTIQDYQMEFLKFALSQGVLKFGSFVLKSGRTSPYFFNAGLFSSGAALYKLGKSYASAIMNSTQLVSDGTNVQFDVIFGPAYKGISLGAVVCAALYSDYGVDVGYAYNRKEAKDHGEGGKLVGAPLKDKRILVVDDVITAGTAIRESFTMLQEVGVESVAGVVIALDRAEKRSLEDPVSAVQAVARDLSVPVVSIVNLPQLQSFLEQESDTYGPDVLASVAEYRSQYGV